MKYFYIPLFLLAVASAFAQPPQSMNMTLFDQMNPVDSVGAHSALWGYTAPDGREYALFGSQIGTHIVDITEKPIRQVAYIWGPKSAWREMKVYRNYAYIVTESRDSGLGLQIVDLTDLPRSATLVNTDTMSFRASHTVYIRDHYLYAMGTDLETGAPNRGTLILDLEPDPIHPRQVGLVDPHYHHDSWVRGDTLVGSALGFGFDIYDIRDKANPVRMAAVSYPSSGTHNAEMTRDGKYVVTSDEVGGTPKTMKVWDISDMENISKVADFTNVPADVIHNVHIIDRYAFVAWYTAGVRVIDMIDPRHPREVAYYDTYPGWSGGYNGVWEVFAGFPSGKIIASDRQTGLYVLEFDSTTAGSVSGIVRDASNNQPLAGVKLYIPQHQQTIVTDVTGRYYVGGANGESVSIVASKFTYGGVTQVATFSGDQTRDIVLAPLTLEGVRVHAKDTSGAPITGFQVAVEPYIHAVAATGTEVSVSLPRDSSYIVTTGKWGYEIERDTISIPAGGRDLEVTLHRRYHDEATLDLGWSFEDPSDNAVTGRWLRILPYLTANSWWFHPVVQADQTVGHVFQTGAPDLVMNANVDDVNLGHTTLTSPSMDLTDHPDPVIAFDLWFVHYKHQVVRDSLLVQVSNDDGASWKTMFIDTLGTAGWKTRRIYPRDSMLVTDRMRVRFRVSDSTGDAYVFAAMDNFVVGFTRLDVGVDDARDDAAISSMLSLTVIPNPVRDGGTISLRALQSERLRLEIYDERGRRVAVLYDGSIEAGDHSLALPATLRPGWYALRAAGRDGSTGVVFTVY